MGEVGWELRHLDSEPALCWLNHTLVKDPVFLLTQHDFKNQKQTNRETQVKNRSKLNSVIQCWSRKQGVWDTSLLAGKTIMFSLSGTAFLLLFLSQQPIFNNDILYSKQTVNNNLTPWWLAIPGLHAKDASDANFRWQVNQLPHTEFHPYHFL